jgi:hypothetical protein
MLERELKAFDMLPLAPIFLIFLCNFAPNAPSGLRFAGASLREMIYSVWLLTNWFN